MSNPITMETMRSDHRQQRETHAQWRQDIQRWQSEHEEAITRLVELQRVVQQHGEALAEYARTVRQSDEAIDTHDRAIADFLTGRAREPQDVLANKHQAQQDTFSRQKSAHERIRKHHQLVLAQLETLEKAAAAAIG